MAPHARKLALVTGASSGIGLELAREFAMRGHDLVIASNEATQLEAAKIAIATEHPDASVRAIVADLSHRDGVEELWRKVMEKGRPVDVVAANAGIGSAGCFADTDLERELETIGLNVAGQVMLCKLAVRQMLEQGHGRLLITSSLVALTPGPFMAVYAGSKAFLHSFGLAIRNELKETPVRVTVLMPGATESRFWERARMEDTEIGSSDKDSPGTVAREAVDALEKDAAWIVPGLGNKVRARLASLTPPTVLAEMNRNKARK